MGKALEATFDGDVFRPDEAVGLRPNTRVRLTVELIDALTADGQFRQAGFRALWREDLPR